MILWGEPGCSQGTPATVAKQGLKATSASHIAEGAGVDECGDVFVGFHESAWMSVQGLGVGCVWKGLVLGSARKGIMLVSHCCAKNRKISSLI